MKFLGIVSSFFALCLSQNATSCDPCMSGRTCCVGGQYCPDKSRCCCAALEHCSCPLPPTPRPTPKPTVEAPTLPPTVPTVSAPTDSAPTASAPTDSAPTAIAPTAIAPTVIAPTASVPTASVPTASVPTASAPTASAPTASAPTASAPTAPTAIAPTANVPTASTPTAPSEPTAQAPTAMTPTARTESPSESPKTSAPSIAPLNGHQFFFLTDVRIEPFFDSSNMQGSSCRRAVCDEVDDECEPFLSPDPSSSFDSFGRSGCNPPIGLFTSALSKMQQLNSAPDFILPGGDFASDNLTQASFQVVLKSLLAHTRDMFPSSTILPILGNTDLRSSNLSLAQLFDMMSGFGAFPNSDVKKDFTSGGYYGWQTENLYVLILNTALMAGDASRLMADAQWAWLEQQLNLAKKARAKVLLSGHVPPGLQDGKETWSAAAAERYRLLVQQHSQEVMLQLFGHHSLDLLRASSPQFALLVSAGLSPVNSMPTFMSFTHNSSVAKDALTFFCDLNAAAASRNCTWTSLPPLILDFNMSDVSAPSLFAAVSAINTKPALGGRYLDRQLLTPFAQLSRTPEMDKADICETGALSAAARSSCLAGVSSIEAEPSRAGYVAWFVLGSLGVVALLVWIAVMYRQMRKTAEIQEEETGAKRYEQLNLGWH